MSTALFAAGGLIFVVLGLLHAAFTLTDLRRPRRLVPSDAAVMHAMAACPVRLAGPACSMWSAWVGFNLSHSLGALMFGAAAAAWGLWPAGTPLVVAWLPAALAALYLAIGLPYWFKTPNSGIALALGCFVLAALAG